MHTSTLSPQVSACRDACAACAQGCLQTLYQHCLMMGGEHVAAEHVTTMADCAQICQTAADFMTRGSRLHAEVCTACAAICTACAEDCREMEGMESCAAACERCAASCQEMERHTA